MISTNIVASLILERSSKHDHSLQYIFHVSTPIYQHYFHPQQNPYYAYRNPQEMDRVKKKKQIRPTKKPRCTLQNNFKPDTVPTMYNLIISLV